MTGPERVGISEAALIAGIPKRTLQAFAAAGGIPGAAKVDRQWSFDEAALRAWIATVVAETPAKVRREMLAKPSPSLNYLAGMRAKPGCPDQVYFIQAASGHIKIGLAFNPRLRMLELQVGHPLPLTLLASIKGGVEAERFLHEFYAAERIRGEWFAPSDRLLAFIDRLKP